MSASADLQQAITDKLKATHTEAIGDGVETTFPIEHGFGTKFLYAVIKSGSTVLVNGTDYSIVLTDRNTVTVTALHGAPANGAWTVKLFLLRVDVTVLSYRDKEFAKKIAQAAANHGLCIFVMPPLPQRALQGGEDVFFPSAEVRVRIVEQPAKNRTGADAYDLVDDVIGALHWQLFGTILAHPLQLAQRPVDPVEDVTTRMFDVVFEATYGLLPGTGGTDV